MEWVETTAKTVDEARNAALDQLGVAADEAEFDVVEEPRPGLFGRLRGEARVRARVKPATVRPKQDRRRRSRAEKRSSDGSGAGKGSAPEPATAGDGAQGSGDAGQRAGAAADAPADGGNGSGGDGAAAVPDATQSKKKSKRGGRSRTPGAARQEQSMNDDERPASPVTPDEVGAAAVTFLEGLTRAFGHDEATTTLDVQDLELDVSVQGEELGLLIGPGGRTLTAIQDLARVASQRRLGDHDTRLRIDIAGYRERRQAALTRFAHDVAESVRSSGTPRSLEPMTSSDRKIIHDVLNDEAGVTSRSEGDDPDRRIVVEPA